MVYVVIEKFGYSKDITKIFANEADAFSYVDYCQKIAKQNDIDAIYTIEQFNLE